MYDQVAVIDIKIILPYTTLCDKIDTKYKKMPSLQHALRAYVYESTLS